MTWVTPISRTGSGKTACWTRRARSSTWVVSMLGILTQIYECCSYEIIIHYSMYFHPFMNYLFYTYREQVAIWWKSQRTVCGRLFRKKSGQAATRRTGRQKWNLGNFSFLQSHMAVPTVTKQLGEVYICKLNDTFSIQFPHIYYRYDLIWHAWNCY